MISNKKILTKVHDLYKNNKLFSLAIALILILISISFYFDKNLPYEFYTIKRVLLFGSLGYLSYFYFKTKHQILLVIYSLGTIVFNPLMPIFLKRPIWSTIDLILFITVIYSILIYLKTTLSKVSSLQEVNSSEQHLNILKRHLENIENCNIHDWTDKIKIIGTTIGHFNELVVKKLAYKYSTDYHHSLSDSINELKPHLSKNIINDLYFLNKFRNKIVHYKDYNSSEMDYTDLTNANEATRKYYTNEAILAFNKATFIYEHSKM